MIVSSSSPYVTSNGTSSSTIKLMLMLVVTAMAVPSRLTVSRVLVDAFGTVDGRRTQSFRNTMMTRKNHQDTKLFAGKQQQQQRQGRNNNNKAKQNSMKSSSSSLVKKKNNNKKRGSDSTSTNASVNNMAGGTTPKKSKQQHVAPPWQVISQKDMKQNLAAEQARRMLAQSQGGHMTPRQIEEAKSDLKRSTAFLSAADKSLLGWKPFSLSPSSHRVDFVGAFLNKQVPTRIGAPEVAFLGRSNVGKSSLLNRLLGRSSSTDVARVGKTPGATASVNLFGVYETKTSSSSPTSSSSSSSSKRDSDNNKAVLGLVDLPGFGYAKLAKETQQSIQETAEIYLENRQELALGILLVDIRRVPTVDDKTVLAALFDLGLPIIVVATKVDKLSSAHKVDQALQTINMELGLPEGQPLCISSVSGQGVKDLWKIIMEACEDRVAELKSKIEGGTEALDDELNGSTYEEIKALVEERPDDEDEISYSQGYDWLQGAEDFEDGSFFGSDDDYEWDGNNGDEADLNVLSVEEKSSIKSLRRRAKDMERKGEI